MAVKIFAVHHKVCDVFRNEVFEPIQTGARFSGIDLGFLRDDVDDNIAAKNPYYGELTAWYWVLKNWLPAHPEVSHVGFCHYRRVLDISRTGIQGHPPYAPIKWLDFEKIFNSRAYSCDAIEQEMMKYDLIVPVKDSSMSFRSNFIGNVLDQYAFVHPIDAMERCIASAVINKLASPEAIKRILLSTGFHTCLNFVMRRDLFESLSCWMFRLLNDAFPNFDRSVDLSYNAIRAPAFVAERFFDVWLSLQDKRLRVKECLGYLIGDDPTPHDIPWYLSGVKQWLLWRSGIKRHVPIPMLLL